MHDHHGDGHYPGKGSTGPKTPEGKARAARNALKHGLRAQRFVQLDEDEGAFREYRIELIHELAPVGTLETALADQIAQCSWRLQRIMPAEAQLFDSERAGGVAGPLNLGQVFALPSFGGPRGIALLIRYETALSRKLETCIRRLRAEQAARQAERPALDRESGLAPAARLLLEAYGMPQRPAGPAEPGSLSEPDSAEAPSAPAGPGPALESRPPEFCSAPGSGSGEGPQDSASGMSESADGQQISEQSSPSQLPLAPLDANRAVRDGGNAPPSGTEFPTGVPFSERSSPRHFAWG